MISSYRVYKDYCDGKMGFSDADDSILSVHFKTLQVIFTGNYNIVSVEEYPFIRFFFDNLIKPV